MLGELGYPANGFTSTPAALVTEFNRRLPALAAEMPNCCVVSAKALNCRGDGLHFDTPSLREFGRRYYRAWQELAKNTEYFTAWNLPDFLQEELMIVSTTQTNPWMMVSAQKTAPTNYIEIQPGNCGKRYAVSAAASANWARGRCKAFRRRSVTA